MAETPYGPYSGGPPGRRGSGAGGRARGRGPRPATWERSFRCPSTARRPVERPMARYSDFVRLHEAAEAEASLLIRRIWWVGASFGVLAGALTFAIVLLLRGVLGLQVPAFAGEGVGTEAAALSYAVCALAGTVQATALLHVLVVTAARPVRAFAWIGSIVVVLLTLIPLTLRGPPAEALLGTSGLNLAGGATVVTVLAAVTSALLRRPGPR